MSALGAVRGTMASEDDAFPHRLRLMASIDVSHYARCRYADADIEQCNLNVLIQSIHWFTNVV